MDRDTYTNVATADYINHHFVSIKVDFDSSPELNHRSLCQEEKTMKYIVETRKSVEQAVADFEAAVQRHKFGVLHIHNLQETLKKKGVDFPNACQVLEICNPQSAKEVLTEDMDLNMALPCRVSVYSDGGKTKIGMMKPSAMLKALSDSPALALVAQEVEETITEMIAEAK